MKGSLMIRTPKISDVHAQTIVYENHKKKLSSIRQERKNFLGFDTQRSNQIENIKMAKSRSFIHCFNQHSKGVSKGNNLLLEKLQFVKRQPSRYKKRNQTHERSTSYSLIQGSQKKYMDNSHKENIRLALKMHSMSSQLSAKRFNSEYQKTALIKQRIQRFTSNDDKISLKSERSFQQMNRSKVSLVSIPHKSTQRFKSLTARKSTFVNHYRKDQILRNQVESQRDRNIQSVRQDLRKGNTLLANEKLAKISGRGSSHHGFLTEPEKRTIVSRKVFKRN